MYSEGRGYSGPVVLVVADNREKAMRLLEKEGGKPVNEWTCTFEGVRHVVTSPSLVLSTSYGLTLVGVRYLKAVPGALRAFLDREVGRGREKNAKLMEKNNA